MKQEVYMYFKCASYFTDGDTFSFIFPKFTSEKNWLLCEISANWHNPKNIQLAANDSYVSWSHMYVIASKTSCM